MHSFNGHNQAAAARDKKMAQFRLVDKQRHPVANRDFA